jgi:hypothetical protein
LYVSDIADELVLVDDVSVSTTFAVVVTVASGALSEVGLGFEEVVFRDVKIGWLIIIVKFYLLKLLFYLRF